MSYQSLEQRMLQTYLDTFPPFVPLRTAEVSEASQRQFYDFLEGMYQSWSRDPSIWFSVLHEDDAHPNRFNKSSYGKPKLIGEMRKVLKTVDSFLSLLFTLGAEGRPQTSALVLRSIPRIPRKQRAAMELLGLKLDGVVLSHERYPDMFHAWHRMAARPGASVLTFSRCMFDPEYAYTSDIFRRLSGNAKAFDALEAHLRQSGYRREDCRGGQVTWDYVRSHGDDGAEVGNFVFDHHHTGVAAEYESVVESPQCFALRILRMREIVPLFNEMDDDLKDFVIQNNPKCSKCDYCILRHKHRAVAPKRFYTTVEHRGRHYNLCPLFPGFSYCWASLNEERVKGMIAFLSFMERKLSPAAAQG